MFIGADISELSIGRSGGVATPLMWAFLVPSRVAIWYRSAMSRRIIATVLGSVFGIAIWSLVGCCFNSGLFTNSIVIGAVTRGSMIASGIVEFLFAAERKTRARRLKEAA